MADRWYYAHDEHKMGPFSGQQLKDLADSGQILTTDTVWKEGAATGVLARKVKGLFPPAAAGALAGSTETPRTKASSSQPSAGTPSAVELPPAVESAPSGPSPDARPDAIALPTGTPPEPSSPAGATDHGSQAVAMFPETIELESEEKAPAARSQPSPPQTTIKKGRAVGAQGAVIVGQDGINVRFRKKCTVCGHEDHSSNTMAIRHGTMRTNFFCSKCRKNRVVTIQGSLG
jgi:hypothetical protein